MRWNLLDLGTTRAMLGFTLAVSMQAAHGLMPVVGALS